MKRIATYNIDDKILVLFNKKAEKNTLNKSQWIQKKMVEYLKEDDK